MVGEERSGSAGQGHVMRLFCLVSAAGYANTFT